jgi:TonB family protein
MLRTLIAVAAALSLAQVPAVTTAARFRSGTVPELPASVVGGGEVYLEVAVSASGRVTAVTPLRTTPPFTDLVTAAVRDWQFTPAVRNDVAVPSTVLVAAIFRAPVVAGPTIGEVPQDSGTGSGRTAYPVSTAIPPFPPTAQASGVVLVEANVDSLGTVANVVPIRSAPPFDEAATQAVRQWRFRPARFDGAPTSTYVYVILGFPLPIVGRPALPGNPPSPKG